MMTRSTWPFLATCTPLEARIHGFGCELFVQRKLLDERVGELRVIVDDQDFARVGHGLAPDFAAAPWVARSRSFGGKRASVAPNF